LAARDVITALGLISQTEALRGPARMSRQPSLGTALLASMEGAPDKRVG